MRKYTDVMGNPITVDDVRIAVKVAVKFEMVSPLEMHRATRWGTGKASHTLTLLTDAGVLSKMDKDRVRSVILRNEDEAVNAALRQLKKGRK